MPIRRRVSASATGCVSVRKTHSYPDRPDLRSPSCRSGFDNMIKNEENTNYSCSDCILPWVLALTCILAYDCGFVRREAQLEFTGPGNRAMVSA